MQTISTSQAAKILGVTRSTVWRWAQSGIVRHARITPTSPLRVSAEDIERMRAQGVPQ